MDVKEEESTEIYTDELFQRSEGYCFGDWGLINHQNRTCSVYALEDTYLFSLNFENFEKTFFKCLQNSDQQKRNFLKENLFPFPISSHDYSKILYNNLVPIECNKNFKIFSEGEKAKCLFIIYKGEFILRKKIFNHVNNENQNHKILSIGNGTIIGLESLFENNSNYIFSLYSSNNYDNYYLFSLTVDKVPLNILLKMKIHLKEKYNNFHDFITRTVERQVNIREKIIRDKSLPSLLNEDNKYQNIIKNYLESREMKKNHENQNNNKDLHNMKLEKTKINIHPFQITNKIKHINSKKNKFINSSFMSISKNNTLSRNSSLFKLNKVNEKKKNKNITLNSSLLINYNIEKKFQLKKSISQKIMTRDTKFSSKDQSSLFFHTSKNLNKNNSDNTIDLQKTIGKHILNNQKNSKLKSFSNKNFIKPYCTGSYNIPLISSFV